QDLHGFFAVIATLVKPGGRMVLHEFHPVQRKLFQDGGPADYFNAELMIGDVPNPVPGGPSLGTCAFRLWTLGEVVTATIAAGRQVGGLEEHPDGTAPPTIPATFTLVARQTAQGAEVRYPLSGR